jgi:hypothetical protein
MLQKPFKKKIKKIGSKALFFIVESSTEKEEQETSARHLLKDQFFFC